MGYHSPKDAFIIIIASLTILIISVFFVVDLKNTMNYSVFYSDWVKEEVFKVKRYMYETIAYSVYVGDDHETQNHVIADILAKNKLVNIDCIYLLDKNRRVVAAHRAQGRDIDEDDIFINVKWSVEESLDNSFSGEAETADNEHYLLIRNILDNGEMVIVGANEKKIIKSIGTSLGDVGLTITDNDGFYYNNFASIVAGFNITSTIPLTAYSTVTIVTPFTFFTINTLPIFIIMLGVIIAVCAYIRYKYVMGISLKLEAAEDLTVRFRGDLHDLKNKMESITEMLYRFNIEEVDDRENKEQRDEAKKRRIKGSKEALKQVEAAKRIHENLAIYTEKYRVGDTTRRVESCNLGVLFGEALGKVLKEQKEKSEQKGEKDSNCEDILIINTYSKKNLYGITTTTEKDFLFTIIENLLKNAFAAAKLCDEGRKFVKVEIKQSSDNTMILTVVNSIKYPLERGNVEAMNRRLTDDSEAAEGSFSTKSEAGSGRGLRIIRAAVKKCGYKIEFNASNDEIEFTLHIKEYTKNTDDRIIRLAEGDTVAILDDDLKIVKDIEDKFIKTEGLNIIRPRGDIDKAEITRIVSEVKTVRDGGNYILFLCDYDLGTENKNGLDIITQNSLQDVSILISSQPSISIENMTDKCKKENVVFIHKDIFMNYYDVKVTGKVEVVCIDDDLDKTFFTGMKRNSLWLNTFKEFTLAPKRFSKNVIIVLDAKMDKECEELRSLGSRLQFLKDNGYNLGNVCVCTAEPEKYEQICLDYGVPAMESSALGEFIKNKGDING